MRPTTLRVALLLLALVAALSVAELLSRGFRDFTQDHPLITTFVTEAVLLTGVYLVIDEIIQRRETRRWSDVTSLGVRALSIRAHELSRIIGGAVSEFAIESGLPRHQRSTTASSTDYEKVVSDRAGELGDWVRDDDQRARAFARGMRQGASGLEEAIIRWGPTLVEDPGSAALLNLLPDIVDAARSAARSVDRGGRTDGAVNVARDWTDDDRKSFADSLIIVLRNADQFDERLRVGSTDP